MKLFASDFDGTFFFGNDDSTFESNIKAAKEFQKENRFAFVTGRSPQALLYHLKSKNLVPDYIAGYNGGIVCDDKMNVLYESMPQIELDKIRSILKKDKILSMTCANLQKVYVKNYDFHLRLSHAFCKKNNVKRVRNIHQLDHLYICALLCKDEIQAKRICEKIEDLHMDCSVYVNRNYIDIVGKNASKKKAVEIIQQHVKADEIYVMGDSYNDVSMIEYFHGFTLQSANDEIKQKASHIFSSVEEAIHSILHK